MNSLGVRNGLDQRTGLIAIGRFLRYGDPEVHYSSPFCSRLVMVGLGVGVLLTLIQAGQDLWRYGHRRSLMEADYAPPPPGMVFIPAGYFLMGSDDPMAEPDERPMRWMFVPAFYMDRFEVTNRRYREIRKDHVYPQRDDELPVGFVLKEDAQAYARAVGKRLPTGAEWEKAARGTDGRPYPWGFEFEPALANVRSQGTHEWGGACLTNPHFQPEENEGKKPVGSFPRGASPYGCEDMSGNVWEWVSDEWCDRGVWGFENGDRRSVIRGGGYAYSFRQARVSYQGFEGLGATCQDVGFRCALDARRVP